ncbi:hypothetical protein CKALI_01320 [Corynebacterium kalinowskii]|uniref:Uncharacterized protein n=2 Tax=Corynebacterium kalinowskii TaxID=2675216 RepID=A0A6B8V9Y6_9CORY|nr:hypothetical protein CKALI_01320 [Corynebacterium kalinowskii]
MGYQGARSILVVLFVLWTPASFQMLYDHGEIYCGVGVVLSLLVLIAYAFQPRRSVGIIGALLAGVGWANDTLVALKFGPDDPVINIAGLVLYLGVALVVIQLIVEWTSAKPTGST